MSMVLELFNAFWVGGILCTIAQILIDKTKITPGKILVCYVVSGVILGGIGIYPIIADFAGAGASLPLTGFGNIIAEGARKSVDEKGLLGVLSAGMDSCAVGISCTLVFSLIASIIFRGKPK